MRVNEKRMAGFRESDVREQETMTRRTRILFVGDSVTAGFGLAGAPTFAQLTAERLAERGLAVDVFVDALDGADSRYILRRFQRMITSHDPDWVVLAVGLNDARPPEARTPCEPATFAGNLLEIVDRILSLGANVLVVAQNPRWNKPPAEFASPQERAEADLMQQYTAVVHGIAEALKLPVGDIHRAMLDDADGAELIPDGTHPNALGHELMADLVTEELLPLLGEPIESEQAKSTRSPYDTSYSPDAGLN